MKNKELFKEIFVQVVIAIIIQLIISGLGYIYSFLNKEKMNITVCTSIKLDSKYLTSINIKNYQDDKSIGYITIWSSANIDANSINYNDVEIYNDRIILKNIKPSYDGTIILYSSEKIDENNTKFETQEKKTLKFLCNQKEEISVYWNQIISNVITYVIIYTVMGVIVHIITERQLDLYKQRIEQIENANKLNEKECAELDKQLEARKKEIMEVHKAQLKFRIFIHRRLVDYKKELEFYKNLIKSIVKDENSKDDICYHITKELKTYKTLEKINAEDLEIDALVLSEEEREEIRKQNENWINKKS